MKIVITDKLTEDAKNIRERVFVKEQEFINEFDEIDNAANHLVMYDENIPVACCRYYQGENRGEYVVGRLAVVKGYRGKRLGLTMLNEVEKDVLDRGGNKLSLSAQLRVKGFYEKQGFVSAGEVYFDEYCEHIHMEKLLDK